MRAFFDAFEAAVFDLDGTLIDSMGLWDNLPNDWLGSLDKKAEPSLESDLMTMNMAQIAAYMKERYALDFSREEIAAQWGHIMRGRYLKGARLKQGTHELLKALSQKGMNLGIATYSFSGSCEAILEHHGIKSFFSSFVYALEFEEASFASGFTSVKKDPQFWRAVAARLNAAPAQCVVFEDSVSSFEGVRAAGMSFAAVYDPSCSNWPELRKVADVALDYPGEALKYL